MSNRDLVGRGLELLADELRPFVDTRMTAAVPGAQDWISVLAACDRSRSGTGHRNSLSDARFLLTGPCWLSGALSPPAAWPDG